jgi:hypothetical protein
MKNDFSVESWFFGQPITARIVVNDFRVYRQYHPVIVSGIAAVDLGSYYFISGYDGNLELNKAPENEFVSILLQELANAITVRLQVDSETYPMYAQSFTSHLPGGSPSAAA